jgi:hypothetical protein
MPGLLRGMARTAVVAGTASAVSGRVQRRQNQRWAQQDAGPYEPQQQYAQPPPAAPAPAPAEDRVQQLKDLAALKEQGVLTDQEFASEKARILGG